MHALLAAMQVAGSSRFAGYTLRTSCGAVYCNRSCLFVGAWVCAGGWVCYHDNSKLRASILTKLIKFWPKGEGACGGAKNFGSALLQPARSVCVSSERFFIMV